MQEFKKRTRCLACGEKLTQVIADFPHLPSSAQDLPSVSELSEDYAIDLQLCKCPKCGLIQFDSTPVDYYRDVIRSGGYSSTLAHIRRQEFEHLVNDYGLAKARFLEVGCGRGEFISILMEYDVEAFGIEHSLELVKDAQAKGLPVWAGFTEHENDDLRPDKKGELYDAFLSFNFIEHQPHPDIMLRCIAHNLKEGGIGLITVPSVEYMMEYGSYYEFIRDHIAYYSFETLRNLLNQCGFSVIEEEVLNHDTISVIVRKTKVIQNVEPTISERFAHLTFDKLIRSFKTISDKVDDLINALKVHGKTLALWGASHQGFTLAATTKLGDYCSYVIDSATFKQHRYAPVFHKEIIAPDEFASRPCDAILILAPGFYKEIAKTIENKYIKEKGFDVAIYALFDDEIKVLKS